MVPENCDPVFDKITSTAIGPNLNLHRPSRHIKASIPACPGLADEEMHKYGPFLTNAMSTISGLPT